MQMLATVKFCVGEYRITLQKRFKGCIAGSRVAGQCGRAVMLAAMTEAMHDRTVVPLCIRGFCMAFQVWIDNVYVVSTTGCGAVL